MGLSCTVSEIDGYFSRKLHKFSHTRVFCALADGVPFGIGYRRAQGSEKKRNDGATRWYKNFKTGLAV